MDIRAAEISSILKKQIKDFGKEAQVSEIGQVLSVGDGIARVYGLDNVQAGEMVEFPGGIMGMALNLEATMSASCCSALTAASRKATRSSAPAPSWKCRSARAAGPRCRRLGNPIDGKGPIEDARPRQRGREGAGHHPAQVRA
jgi:F-type H+-transporting ATPase subunit alpha